MDLFQNMSVQSLRYVSAKQPTTAPNHATDLATPEKITALEKPWAKGTLIFLDSIP